MLRRREPRTGKMRVTYTATRRPPKKAKRSPRWRRRGDQLGLPQTWAPLTTRDVDRLEALLRPVSGHPKAVPVGPATMCKVWRTVPKSQKLYAVLRGAAGALVDLWNMAGLTDAFLSRHRTGGWIGIKAMLARRMPPADSVGNRAKRTGDWWRFIGDQALMDAEMFERWGFVPDQCNHRKPHWYFRPTVGRPPKACWLHVRAARQARYQRPRREQAKKRNQLSTG